MSAVPVATSRVILQSEVRNCQLWADRHAWQLNLDLEKLVLDVLLVHPADGEAMLLSGKFDGYRGLPPEWVFLDPRSRQMTIHAWPKAGAIPRRSSIFHSFGVICAHWNRLAYKQFNGPHSDWGDLSGWADMRVGGHAENICEMLSAINVHLAVSPGRMGS